MRSADEILHYSHSATGVVALWKFLEGSRYTKTFAGYGDCLHIVGKGHNVVVMEGDTLYWWEDEKNQRHLAVWRED